MKKSPSSDNPEQSKKFIQASKELECDEEESAFDKKLKKILETSPDQEKGK